MGSHQSAAAATHVWLTPRWILDPLGLFDVDPCAAPGWPTAARHLYEEDDGLSADWGGADARAWVNPPYGALARAWLERLAGHGRGTALVFARCETEGFFSGVWERASAGLFLRGRITFLRPDGTPAEHNGGAPSVLVAYGPDDAEILHGCGIEGHFAPISRAACLFVALAPERGEDAAPDESWTALVRRTVESLGGRASLRDIYARLAGHPKAARNPNWRPKARQSLARAGAVRESPGVYSFAAA
jgi:hypothetical protein